MNYVKILLSMVIDGTSDVAGNKKIPKAVRAIIMLVYTMILLCFISFLVSSIFNVDRIITKVILGLLSVALALIIIRGWRKVIKR